MKTLLAYSRQRRLWVYGCIAACIMVAAHLGAQSVAPRITSDIIYSEQATLQGSLHPSARAQFDAGRMPTATKLNGISLFFSRSAEQEADLQKLIAAQQNPASPLYHQWLTPDQFAARFGIADSDLVKVKSWLEQQGFSIDSVARSRNMIRFSGSSRQVEQAFSTEMHYYESVGSRHFAPSRELSIPTALAPIVLAVHNLSNFRPKPMHIASVRPDYTSSQSGAVHFAPGDIKLAYDIPSGYTGAGQSIAIMGQSAILTSDIENFQSASNLSVKDPTLVLVPGSGSSTVYTGDESESDIDLEWSGAIATGANILFVYTGSNFNYDVSDSIQYAVDENIAPIISVSYGYCETQIPTSFLNIMEAIGAQAISQGQTIVASSGDSGSTGCSGFTGLTTAQQEALAVIYPASSAYVTAAGGTEIIAANSVSTNTTYWDPKSTSDILTSEKVYIPEVVWNDDTLGGGLSSSGGGASALIARPSWQTGVTGIPPGTKRLVPDISLYSSPNYPGYLFCSSDSSVGILQSCAHGFRDEYNQYLTVAGGTSFAAPVFAGMIALINQAKGYSNGQGLINAKLYTMAANGSTYASAFHDVINGNNNCTAGTSLCGSPATGGFSAGTGYDEATGLGSVDLNNLITAWPTNATPLTGTAITISTPSPTFNVNTSYTFTFTVVSTSGSVQPSGNLNLSIDGGGTAYSSGGIKTTVSLAPFNANTATATYTTSFSAVGTHQIIAQYIGNASLAASTGILQVSVGVNSSGTGSFTMAASPSTLTVSQGSSRPETITITPAGGYTGTVLMNYNTSNNTALANLCVFATTVSGNYATVAVGGTSPVQTTLTFDTFPSDCGNAQTPVGGTPFRILSRTKISKNNSSNPVPLGVAFAGLLFIGFLGRRSRKFFTIAGVVVLLAVALTISSCGGGGNTSNNNNVTPDPPKGSYTITITAQDSSTATITAQTSFNLVIQ